MTNTCKIYSNVSTLFYMFMNPTTKSMTNIEIENHLRNQINSLNKEIHTKQGIIGKVQGIQSAQGLNLSLGGVPWWNFHPLGSKPSKKSKDITSNSIWISVLNTGLSDVKWNCISFICKNFLHKLQLKFILSEMNWKEQERIGSKSQTNSSMLSNFFKDKYQNSIPKVRKVCSIDTLTDYLVPVCPVCLKQYRNDSIYCIRSCGHTICGSCSQLLTARSGMTKDDQRENLFILWLETSRGKDVICAGRHSILHMI